jgi:hypothetical protein
MKFLRTALALCANFRQYRTIRDVTVAASLRYLILLVFPVTLLTLLALMPVALHRVDELAEWMDRHLPAFAIKDGHVTSAVPEPYRVDADGFLFILDTTGTTTQPDTNALQGLVLNSDSFMFWIGATNGPAPVMRTQHSSLRGLPDGNVTGAYFRQLFRSFLWVGGPVAWVLLAGIALLIILVHAIIFASFAAVMDRGAMRALSFWQLLNIAIHAATPAILVNAAFLALQLESVNLWWLYLIVYGVYLIGAVAASREPVIQDMT